jgi:hypothetical protein
MKTNIKFGIRFGNQKRGKIITNMTVLEYLDSLGATSRAVCPNSGWAKINGKIVEFGLTIY